MTELEKRFGHPVDIEFASDGADFYLLQCRSQSYSEDNMPAVIPVNLSKDQIVFTANRYVSNGVVPNVTHIVFVDPHEYSKITNHSDLLAVGRAVGRLNQMLPRRKFILMGPGRWGSRGDIKLGVSVTYSDINNTAALIEIASKRGDYTPELSFGTHFFQDLVEASIRYLPLYPDDYGIVFNTEFLMESENMLADFIPDFEYLSRVIHVIDVNRVTGGKVLQILMNADKIQALGMLSEPEEQFELETQTHRVEPRSSDEHWLWRQKSVESIAAHLNPERFGVVGFYVFGSTKNADAGPRSDIDVLIHFRGTVEQRKDLKTWLEGWSLCLGQVNFTRTGYKVSRLLDVHIVTDEDIEKRTSYAAKIGAVTDPARPLTMGTSLVSEPEGGQSR
jgi:predicted nucleotidyltransferase